MEEGLTRDRAPADPISRPSTVQTLMQEAIRQAERRMGDPGSPLPFSKSLRRALIKVGRIVEAHRSQIPGRWGPLAREVLGEEGGQLGAFILQDFEELDVLAGGDAEGYLQGFRVRARSMALTGTPMGRMLRALEAQGEVLLGILLENVPAGPPLWRCTRALDRLLFNRVSVVTDVYFEAFRRGTEVLRDVMAEISDIEENLWSGVIHMAATRPDPRAFLADIYDRYLTALNLFSLQEPPVKRVQDLSEGLEAYAQTIRNYFGCQDEEYSFRGHDQGIDVVIGPHCFYAGRCQEQRELGLSLFCFKTRSMEQFVPHHLGRPVKVQGVALDPGRRCLLRAQEVQGNVAALVTQPSSEVGRSEAKGFLQGLPPVEPMAPMDAGLVALLRSTYEGLEPFLHRVLLDWVKLATPHFQPRDLTILYRLVQVDLAELGDFVRSGKVERYLEEWGDFARHLADGGVPLSALVRLVKLQGEALLPFIMASNPSQVEAAVRAHERLNQDRLVVTARAYREALQEDALNLARVLDQYNTFTDALWIALIQRASDEGEPLPFLQAFMDLQFQGFVRAQAQRRPIPPYSPDLLGLTRGIMQWMRTLPESPAYRGRAAEVEGGVAIAIHQGCPNEARCKLMQKHGIPLVCVEALYFRAYAKYYGHDVSIRQGLLDPGRECHSTLLRSSSAAEPGATTLI